MFILVIYIIKGEENVFQFYSFHSFRLKYIFILKQNIPTTVVAKYLCQD